ncbi:MAG: hypothetical protein DMG65_19305 [Candidatus Angelobacter sp. Gp1-AA117]|nr:MAG: hypothetical protein DMG65_19305 [Candidatus Angelobacter sp. Gp1-AA117]
MDPSAKTAHSAVVEHSCVTELSRFFPEAIPVRIPVRVSRTEDQAVAENTVIEYGTSQEVLLASSLPLDFDDRIHLKNSDGTLDVEAEIVAMQLHHGKTAVAARFLKNVTNWIIKK